MVKTLLDDAEVTQRSDTVEVWGPGLSTVTEHVVAIAIAGLGDHGPIRRRLRVAQDLRGTGRTEDGQVETCGGSVRAVVWPCTGDSDALRA